MGLISRVSSRTYRDSHKKNMRSSIVRSGLKWGHMARPYYINGLVKQELTHTQAESFPNLVDRFWNLNRRFRREAPYWILGSLPFIYSGRAPQLILTFKSVRRMSLVLTSNRPRLPSSTKSLFSEITLTIAAGLFAFSENTTPPISMCLEKTILRRV